MKKFKEYLTESSTVNATQMEKAILDAWDENETGSNLEPAAKLIVKQLRSKGLTGKTKHLGSGTYDITDEWKDWGGVDKTPKTDIIIGKYKISLKMGQAQLMSGSRKEATATCLAAISETNLQGKDYGTVAKILSLLDEFVDASLTQSGSVTDALKAKEKVVIEGDKTHKEMMKIMGDFFESNDAFKFNFVKEAIGGKWKFGDSSLARASHLLACSPDGKIVKIHESEEKKYINKIKNDIKLQVRYKSTSQKTKQGKTGKYKFWSVISLITGKIEEEFEQYNGQMITEGIVSSIINRVKNFVKKILLKIRDNFRSGLGYVIDFLDLDINPTFINAVDYLIY